MEITRKMSVAGINGMRKGFKSVAALEFVARILGVAESVMREQTQTGAEQWKFTGEFQGVNADGKEFGAPVLYLPGPADSQLTSAMSANVGKSVKFAYDIFVEPDKTSPIGYVTRVKPLLEPTAIATLLDISGSLPPAPVPSAETPPADPPAPTPSEAPKSSPKKK